MRTGTSGLLAASLALCAAGCGTRTEAPDPALSANPDLTAATDRKAAERDQKAMPAGAIRITVEVKGMTKALNIT